MCSELQIRKHRLCKTSIDPNTWSFDKCFIRLIQILIENMVDNQIVDEYSQCVTTTKLSEIQFIEYQRFFFLKKMKLNCLLISCWLILVDWFEFDIIYLFIGMINCHCFSSRNSIRKEIKNVEQITSLEQITIDIILRLQSVNCYGILIDERYYNDFSMDIFMMTSNKTNYLIRLSKTEDLLSPNYKTVKVLKEIRKQGCEMYIVYLENTNQMLRFLQFSNK